MNIVRREGVDDPSYLDFATSQKICCDLDPLAFQLSASSSTLLSLSDLAVTPGTIILDSSTLLLRTNFVHDDDFRIEDKKHERASPLSS
jgi:hypothetical protein